MVWSLKTSNGNETAKIRWSLPPYTRGKGVDLGCGPYKAFPHFIGVDNGHHEIFGQSIKPDVKVETCEKLDIFASQSLDFVYSSHLLEHIVDYKAALKEWWRVIKVGGHLVLYIPHKEFYPNIGQEGANPDHKHDFVPQDIIDAMPKGWDLVEKEDRNEGDEYSFFLVFKKHAGQKNTFSCNDPKPAKTCALIRYGAFGDLLQASSVIAGLKKQGYHITLYSSPPGSDVIKLDPNIDKFILQDKDQVPNECLGEFWDYTKKKYDHWVNLSESVEGSFLALPGRTQHQWPATVRHKMMNRNYLEFQHELAGVPHVPQVKFYASSDEKAWAKKERSKLGPFVILWQLAGSSVHKTWAGLDAILARILTTYPAANIVLSGGPEAEILEKGWENEPRIKCTSGKWSIRQTLAFVEHADLMIGPETGVMNSACDLPMPKIVFLSHSTVENLTRDWKNTISLISENTVCPGRGNNQAPACHQLHYGWAHCKRSEEGVAQCQTDITVDSVWDAVKSCIEARRLAA